MFENLGMDGNYNHCLPVEPQTASGSLRVQVVRKDPYKRPGEQDPPFVIQNENGLGVIHSANERPRPPEPKRRSSKESREMHLIAGTDGIVYGNVLPPAEKAGAR